MAWPAFLNGYPILFSDSLAYLWQGRPPWMVWDKPGVYGPMLHALDFGTTLWGVVAGQAVLLSCLLWRVAGGLWVHVLQCLVLGFGSSAPWFAATVMPDVLAPMVVLSMVLIARGGRLDRTIGTAVGALAIAVHLSHLVIAAALIVAVAVLRRERAVAAAVPLAVAVSVLLATNVVGWGRLAVSPFGSVFLLARLTADGPARAVITAACPAAGWRMCAFADRLPGDADVFLWSPDGPVWSDPAGPIGLAPEASVIVWRTVAADPVGVAAAMLGNAAAQLVRVRLGDALGSENLVGRGLERLFGPAEVARFTLSLQMRGGLTAVGLAFNPWHVAALMAGVLLLPWAFRVQRGLVVLVVVGVLANAAATGALAGVHDRYQARIAWLLLVPALAMFSGRRVG